MNGWERRALRLMEFVAYPALAGAAVCVLALGVVTWLPALAAAAYTLQRWRTDGAGRCFTGVLRAFGGYWRELWRESLAGAALFGVLGANTLFLLGNGTAAYLLLPMQLGLLAAIALYGVALAVVSATEPPKRRRRAAAVLAFGSPGRGLMLLAVLVVAPLAVLPIPMGPLLLGPTLPLMFGLTLHAPLDPRIRKVSHA